MSPSLPTPAFLYILDILLSPTLPKFPFFHNCHATPKGHGLPPPPKFSTCTGGEFRMSDGIVFHGFTPLKQIKRKPYCTVFFLTRKRSPWEALLVLY